MCFGLLYLGPAVAFNAYVPCTTLFLNESYGAPILMLVVGGRKVVSEQAVDFKLGRLGPLLNKISVIFIAITSIFLCFPSQMPATSNNMRYLNPGRPAVRVFCITGDEDMHEAGPGAKDLDDFG
ncbi:uncharacterized protein RAG0_05571 [Rhynchosporium agropyri]|uniref:Uncharacterized protein n=1 Tax=Rhynchosporium agropyri TaxID=914238 RepID=A0A1E1KDN5_9HELO|nr:uncharacterized protein RAG0_05571 [Rhynchosporium agropyri]